MTGMLLGIVGAAWAGKEDDAAGEARDSQSRPVGGSLAGWGAVPLASDEERTSGLTHLWGQLQVWTTLYDQDVDPLADPATYGDPEADAGFSLRRGRFGFDGYIPMGKRGGRSQIDYALSVGVGATYDALTTPTAEVQLIDGFGRWALPTGFGVTSVALGLQRVPFSRESMISSADLVFQEVAPGTNWLTPDRQAGAVASQSVSLGEDAGGSQLLLRVGAFNGGGDLFGGSGRGLLGSARLELVVGDPYRTWSAKEENALGVGVAALRDDDLATRTTSFTGDAIARYKFVTLMGEAVASTIEPTNTDVSDPDVVFETARLGILGQLSVWLPLEAAQGVELAARFSTFDDDTDRANNGDVSILHGGATWRNVLPRLDIGAGYVHRIEPNTVANDTIRIWTQIRPEGRF
jgi:hypothetical protein